MAQQLINSTTGSLAGAILGNLFFPGLGGIAGSQIGGALGGQVGGQSQGGNSTGGSLVSSGGGGGEDSGGGLGSAISALAGPVAGAVAGGLLGGGGKQKKKTKIYPIGTKENPGWPGVGGGSIQQPLSDPVDTSGNLAGSIAAMLAQSLATSGGGGAPQMGAAVPPAQQAGMFSGPHQGDFGAGGINDQFAQSLFKQSGYY